MSKIIFIDESGGTTINEFERFYVIAAIIAENNTISELSIKVREYWDSISNSTKVKSSSIGKNFNRRKEILSKINEIMEEFNCSYFCMIIDKKSIPNDSPLQFKRTFYKYPHKLFYNKLLTNLNEYEVIIDKYGDDEFMEGSNSYFNKELDCFKSHSFGTDEDYSLLHLADFIAGSYRRYFEEKDDDSGIEIINFPNAPFYVWPPVYLTRHKLPGTEEIDEQIASITLEAIQEFLETNDDDDSTSINQQKIVLNFLLYEFYKNPYHSVFRADLVNELATYGYKISEQTLSNSILSKLRGKGIILMSTESGVKIPVTIDDINEWLHRAESQTIPYLKKVLIARNKIQIKAGIDILEFYKSPEMKEILNLLKKVIE